MSAHTLFLVFEVADDELVFVDGSPDYNDACDRACVTLAREYAAGEGRLLASFEVVEVTGTVAFLRVLLRQTYSIDEHDTQLMLARLVADCEQDERERVFLVLDANAGNDLPALKASRHPGQLLGQQVLEVRGLRSDLVRVAEKLHDNRPAHACRFIDKALAAGGRS